MSVPSFAPVLAKGKSHIQTVSTYTIGATTTTMVLGAVTGLTQGAHLFAGGSDYSSAEYVGKIATVDGGTNTVVVNWSAQTTRAVGAKVWTPTSSWQATSVPGVKRGGYVRRVDPGITLLDTTGAARMRTQERASRDVVTLSLGMVTVAEWLAWKNWADANIGNGLEWFTAAWKDFDENVRALATVCLDNPERALEPRSVPVYGRRDWDLELAVLTEGAYL